MTTATAAQRGFWYQVKRPFRAMGRGLERVFDVVDLVSGVVQVGRAVVWVFRGIGRVISALFDW